MACLRHPTAARSSSRASCRGPRTRRGTRAGREGRRRPRRAPPLAEPPARGMLRPAAGATQPGRGFVTVRWRASDRDRDRLTFTVDYSPDGGRNWRPVPGRRRAGAAPASRSGLLGASRQGEGPRPRQRRVQRGGRGLAALPRRWHCTSGDDLQSRPPQPDRRQRHGHAGGPSLRRSRPADDRPEAALALGRADRRPRRAGDDHAALLARKLVLEATDYRGRIGRASATLFIRRPKPLFLRLAAAPPEAPGAGAPPARRLVGAGACSGSAARGSMPTIAPGLGTHPHGSGPGATGSQDLEAAPPADLARQGDDGGSARPALAVREGGADVCRPRPSTWWRFGARPEPRPRGAPAALPPPPRRCGCGSPPPPAGRRSCRRRRFRSGRA